MTPRRRGVAHNRAMLRPASEKPPLLVFSDDWGRHPSSSQHLVRRLLRDRQVFWVNTIGTRPFRPDLRTASRVLEKLSRWSRPASRQGPAGGDASPHVLDPMMWPSFRSRFGRRLNRGLLLRGLRPLLQGLAQPPVVVTTLPLVADIVGGFDARRWIYYCVDDFGTWPGYDGTSLRSMERELVARVDEVIAVSERLVEHLRGLGRNPHLLTHGVDLQAWRPPARSDPLPEFEGLEPPFFVFWGAIDRRMDLRFVEAMFTDGGCGTVVLFGPCEDPDPALFTLAKVAVRPPVPFERLAALAQAAAVLVMPYADMPATRSMQPLKLKEYLATDKPVVVSDLPAARAWADACDLCRTPREFAHRVRQRVEGAVPDSQRIARTRLAAESWTAKAKQFEAWIDAD